MTSSANTLRTSPTSYILPSRANTFSSAVSKFGSLASKKAPPSGSVGLGDVGSSDVKSTEASSTLGDPSNNGYFETRSNMTEGGMKVRHGGDLKDLEDKSNYIQGVGVGAICITGTPFLNMP